jgi:uncharacterized protein (DUF2141 family)
MAELAASAGQPMQQLADKVSDLQEQQGDVDVAMYPEAAYLQQQQQQQQQQRDAALEPTSCAGAVQALLLYACQTVQLFHTLQV